MATVTVLQKGNSPTVPQTPEDTMAFYQNLIKGGKGAQAGDMRVEQRLNEAGAGRGAQGTAAEGYATGGVVGKTPNPKIPNPPFKPFGTKPGATPA